MAKLILLNLLHNKYIKTMIRSSSSSAVKTIGILVIGDEILKGQVLDTNSHYLSKGLHKMGFTVQKITVIGDNVNEISEEVKQFSSKYDYVITTGGIGPTHDDVTFEAIAKAFNENLFLHPQLVKLCSRFYQTDDLSSPGMKLARVPQSSILTYADGDIENATYYPSVSVANVYIFPGIPQLCEKLFDTLGNILFKTTNKFYSKVLYFNVTEDKIANALTLIATEHPQVLVGSYPELYNKSYKVKITMESSYENEIEIAYERLLEIVPRNAIVVLDT